MNSRREFIKWLAAIPFLGSFFLSMMKIPAAGLGVMLNVFHVAGVQFSPGNNMLERIKEGDRLQLVLKPDNPYGAFAVKLLFG